VASRLQWDGVEVTPAVSMRRRREREEKKRVLLLHVRGGIFP
jgi:hypothetical protein